MTLVELLRKLAQPNEGMTPLLLEAADRIEELEEQVSDLRQQLDQIIDKMEEPHDPL